MHQRKLTKKKKKNSNRENASRPNLAWILCATIPVVAGQSKHFISLYLQTLCLSSNFFYSNNKQGQCPKARQYREPRDASKFAKLLLRSMVKSVNLSRCRLLDKWPYQTKLTRKNITWDISSVGAVLDDFWFFVWSGRAGSLATSSVPNHTINFSSALLCL